VPKAGIHAHVVGVDPVYSRRNQAKVAASDGYLFDGDKRFGLGRTVAKNHTLQNATWDREIGLVKGTDFYLASARLR
jgi:hypothetical protein